MSIRIKQFKRWPVTAWCLLAGMGPVMAQSGTAKSIEENTHVRQHRLSLAMANAHVPNMNGIAGQNKFAIVPSWGLNYDYWLSERWAIGWHNDLILQQFKILKEHQQVNIERSYPIGSCAVGIFKPLPQLATIAGAGVEFEKEASFAMVKLGLEYGFELPRHFELSINLQYDNKLKAYDTWFFGFAISKKLGGGHE